MPGPASRGRLGLRRDADADNGNGGSRRERREPALVSSARDFVALKCGLAANCAADAGAAQPDCRGGCYILVLVFSRRLNLVVRG